MDLDEEELKMTRDIKAINRIIAPEEKTADEMFEDLGYIKETDDEDLIGYVCGYPKSSRVIGFLKESKAIIASTANMQELQAINKKVEELGWKI